MLVPHKPRFALNSTDKSFFDRASQNLFFIDKQFKYFQFYKDGFIKLKLIIFALEFFLFS